MKTNQMKAYARIGEGVLDADQSVFFARQLEEIEETLYKVKYPDLEAEMLLPRRKMLNPGATKFTWRQFDENGKPVPMAGSEDGAPVVEVSAEESSAKLMSWILGYRYSVEEIDAAKMAGLPLDSMRAEAVRRKLAIEMNRLALLGNTAKGIEGLFSLSNTLTYTVPATGTGSSKLWSTKTADQILVDMFGMVDAMANNTLDVEGSENVALNFVMPKANIRIISSLQKSAASDTTVLEYFKRNRPNVRIMGANYLPTAGASSASRMVVYDPSQVTWLGSIPFQAMPVEQKGFSFVVNCRARGGGVFTPYPKSIVYGDGA